jgi:hypothetical protein
MRQPIKNKKKRIQTCVTFLWSIATYGSDKKKQGNKKKTAINMVLVKMIIAQNAKILPAINCIFDIFFVESLMF